MLHRCNQIISSDLSSKAGLIPASCTCSSVIVLPELLFIVDLKFWSVGLCTATTWWSLGHCFRFFYFLFSWRRRTWSAI